MTAREPIRAAPTTPRTLAIDIGASGLKASVLDSGGDMVVDRVRVATAFPCPPEVLVAALLALGPLRPRSRVRSPVGSKKWNQQVRRALNTLDSLFYYDAVYVGGGNSSRVRVDLGPKATLVDNSAGIRGGIRLWDRPEE